MLTEKEACVLIAILKSEFQPITEGDMDDLRAVDVVDQCVWSIKNIDVGFENERSLSGVMSSLVKKGLVGCSEDEKVVESYCWITQKGFGEIIGGVREG